MQRVPNQEMLDLSLCASMETSVMGLITRSLMRLGENMLLSVLVYGGVLDTDTDVVDLFTKTKKIENLHRTSLKTICTADWERMRRPVEDADGDTLTKKAGSRGETDGTSYKR